MKNHIEDHSVDTEEIPRRKFLGGSVLGGLGIALGLARGAGASPVFDDAAAEECQQVTASDMLAMFSTLAWQVPIRLKEVEDARKDEQVLYGTFDAHYKKLVEHAKKLKLACANLTENDPRKSAAAELAALTNKNFSAPRPGSADGDALYLHISALVIENRQLSRTANEILPQTMPNDDDNTIICDMLAEIRAMENIKGGLDTARKKSDAAFKTFTFSLKDLHANILGASDDAAKAERGEASKEPALKKIGEAEKILNGIIENSVTANKSMITPEGLKVLLAVPKGVLEGKVSADTPITQRRGSSDVQFRTAAYAAPSEAPSPNADHIWNILAKHVVPSNRFTLTTLTGTCVFVLKTYPQNPPRRDAVLNALQSWFWVSSESDFQTAADLIANLR